MCDLSQVQRGAVSGAESSMSANISTNQEKGKAAKYSLTMSSAPTAAGLTVTGPGGGSPASKVSMHVCMSSVVCI